MPKINIDVWVPDGENCLNCSFFNLKTINTNTSFLLQDYCLLYNKPIVSEKKLLDCQAVCQYYSKNKKDD